MSAPIISVITFTTPAVLTSETIKSTRVLLSGIIHCIPLKTETSQHDFNIAAHSLQRRESS